MIARYKALGCGRPHAGIAGSNPAGGMDVSCECCVLAVRGLYEGPIPRREQSYRMCASLSVIRCNNNTLHLHWIGRRGQTKKRERKL
jgi:hypothetical protein